ncbi:MAG: hypothetical protein K8S87_04160 [Planctomycetes bacterium]|nr:hypothetical protein [Planctomycetota bacterium]
MKKVNILVILLFTLSVNLAVSDDNKNSNKVIFWQKCLSNGETATIYKKITTRIVTIEDFESDLHPRLHPILGEYTDQHYNLHLSDSQKIIWSLLYSYPNAIPSQLFENRFIVHDIILVNNIFYILYSHNYSIFYEILSKKNNTWEKYAKIEITEIFDPVKSGNLFQTDSGLYANIQYVVGKELWLISKNDGAIVLWADGVNRKGREKYYRREYRRKLAKIEREERMKAEKEKEAKELKENGDERDNNAGNDKEGNGGKGNEESENSVNGMKTDAPMKEIAENNKSEPPDTQHNADNAKSNAKSRTSKESDLYKNANDKKNAENEKLPENKKSDGTDSTLIIVISIAFLALLSLIIIRRK